MAPPVWLSLDDALNHLRSAAPRPTATMLCNTEAALGRVVSIDIVAPCNVPPLAVSAMDGFAICLDNLTSEIALPVTQTILAGQDISTIQLGKGEAARIMTGAGIPSGADAVVMQENTTYDEDTVTVNQIPVHGENIRPQGNDICRDDIIITRGTRLQARHLMLLASVGQTTCEVYSPLKIGLLATGDEIKAPGTTLNPGQIFNANSIGIAGLLAPLGVQVTDLGICPDDADALQRCLQEAAEKFDLIISSGGVSVGDADHVKPVLDKLGQVDFWKVAIKPGKPFAFGTLGKSLFCGLPGNPVSAYVTTEQLVIPLIASMQGLASSPTPVIGLAALTTDIKRQPGRQEFMRATLCVQPDGQWQVTPLAKQSSGVMTSVTKANAYIVVPAHTKHLATGERVQVLPFTR
ncbi:molybdopterin molybdotransferase MoeA [Salinimonas sp. HHU 13199]|uniref:Molybdopterin molybdenumtransferase n=1 Tax=Salinimonas profundi TaxID=2729140 RepID=A0ABR8LEF3_9ALTE|nr:gephyrin-like molybdotransferase Glp [Salinimonas profundi]MBD3584665.1 molybdopterin molybdotransferase MoeA [Salinimonas profundi]